MNIITWYINSENIFITHCFLSLVLTVFCILRWILHYSQKNNCNDNCNNFSDYNDIVAPLDKLIIITQTWNLSIILHRRIFRLKILHRQFHQISKVLVRKNTKDEWKWGNLHRWQKFYTAAGSDGIDKFHLWWDAHRKKANHIKGMKHWPAVT